MAASNGWIYFGMQPYGHFEEDEADDLLLFYIKEHKEDIVLLFYGTFRRMFDGCVGFAGAHVIWIIENYLCRIMSGFLRN